MRCGCLFFFNDTATTEIYTLSLHDALPILPSRHSLTSKQADGKGNAGLRWHAAPRPDGSPWKHSRATRRSEEHTSELQSRQYLVCRLLFEKNNGLQVVFCTKPQSRLLPDRT